MQLLLRDYLDGRVSRRGFMERLVATGFSAAAARAVVGAADAGAADLEGDETATAFRGTGGELLMEQALAADTKYIFSNPGSVEVGFFDALTDRPKLQLIVALHEGIVIAMADGYHKVSRQPTLVNVHAAVGTAQMGGQMYNAHKDGSMLIVTAGAADTTIYSDDIGLAPAAGFSQTEINRQFTKISWDVRTPSSTAVAIRRAYKLRQPRRADRCTSHSRAPHSSSRRRARSGRSRRFSSKRDPDPQSIRSRSSRGCSSSAAVRR